MAKKKQAKDDDVRLVAPSEIRADGDTQSRSANDPATADEYAAIYREACEAKCKHPCDALPELDAVFDGTAYWLYDGFHRLYAAKLAGLDLLRVRILAGTVHDARWLASAANRTHGLRRTNADKKKAVGMAFACEKSRGMSDRALAEHCGVSNTFVSETRARLSTADSRPAARTGLDGRTTNVSGIGKSPGRLSAVDSRLEADGDFPADFDPPLLSEEESQEAGENLIRMAAEGELPVNLGTTVEAIRPTDSVEMPISDELLEAFASREKFDECAKLLRAAQKLMHDLAAGPGGDHLREELSHRNGASAVDELRHFCPLVQDAISRLKFTRPFASVCPFCLDDPEPGCVRCHGQGWVTITDWESAPADRRDVALSIARERRGT